MSNENSINHSSEYYNYLVLSKTRAMEISKNGHSLCKWPFCTARELKAESPVDDMVLHVSMKHNVPFPSFELLFTEGATK